MAWGHTRPLLDLSQALSCHGITVTIITIPSNVPYIACKVSKHPRISLHVLPFPQVPELPPGCENTAHLPSMDLFLTFLRATKMLKEPFEGVLREMSIAGCLPICVILDFFLEWMLDSCHSFGIPRFVSSSSGCSIHVVHLAFLGLLAMEAIGKATSLHSPCIRAMLDSDLINLSQVKVLFSLKRADLPNSLQKGNADDPWLQFMAEVGEADADSWGFIVNSFEELEGEYVATLESFFKKSYAWCVGQLLLVNQIEQEATSDDQLCWYIKWLNKQLGPSGVICISFGTQAHVSNTQMDEIAMGLEMASHPFIWVVPSTKWTPPDGWEERVKERGLIAKDWVEQRSTLAHPSMGGFLSRCGWNSVLESLLNGIPMLGWPMGAKQGLNAKYVADGLGAGILVDPQPQGRRRVGTEGINTIEHDVICYKVKELMSREREESPREGTRIGDYGKASYGERWIIPQEVGRIDRSA